MTEDQILILDSNGNTIQDAVSTLILIISLYFIKDTSHLKDKNVELLSNLRCKNSVTLNGTKTLSLIMSCSENIQTNLSRKKNSLLDCQPF